MDSVEEWETAEIEETRSSGPLAGLRVLDFSTLVPGPLASLILAEAGAGVLKVERPGLGDEMRTYVPRVGDTSANFALLNRGKRSVVLDLKNPDDCGRALSLATHADVVLEQFRPGVMQRLGLGYEALSEHNPGLIYCSISGYGQTGPRVRDAGHDLNYIAESGLLALTAPALPPVLIADIAGGAYPAVMNILMALAQRATTGRGAYLDIAMTENLFTLAYWALAEGLGAGQWPPAGGGLVTGGSARYNLYATADGQFLAVAPLEDRFWDRFCELIALPEPLRDDLADPVSSSAGIAEIIQSRSGASWQEVFGREDVCCTLVRTLEEAVRDPRIAERAVFGAVVTSGTAEATALPVPLAACYRPSDRRPTPSLGEPVV